MTVYSSITIGSTSSRAARVQRTAEVIGRFPGITLAWAFIAVLVIGLGGCDGVDEPDRAAEVERSRRELADEMSRTAGIERDTAALMFLVFRELDVLYRGEVPRIEIGVGIDGVVRDGLGNTLTLTADEWRAVVVEYEQAIARHGERLSLRSLPGHHYDDGHADVQRHQYRLESLENDRIAFIVLGEVQSDASTR